MFTQTAKDNLLATINQLRQKTQKLKRPLTVLMEQDQSLEILNLNTQLMFSDAFLTDLEKATTDDEIAKAMIKLQKFSDTLASSVNAFLVVKDTSNKSDDEDEDRVAAQVLDTYAEQVIALMKFLEEYKALKNNPLYKGKAPLRGFMHPEEMRDQTIKLLKKIDLNDTPSGEIKTHIIATISSLDYDIQKIKKLSDEMQKTIEGTKAMLTSASQKCILSSSSSASNATATAAHSTNNDSANKRMFI